MLKYSPFTLNFKNGLYCPFYKKTLLYFTLCAILPLFADTLTKKDDNKSGDGFRISIKPNIPTPESKSPEPTIDKVLKNNIDPTQISNIKILKQLAELYKNNNQKQTYYQNRGRVRELKEVQQNQTIMRSKVHQKIFAPLLSQPLSEGIKKYNWSHFGQTLLKLNEHFSTLQEKQQLEIIRVLPQQFPTARMASGSNVSKFDGLLGRQGLDYGSWNFVRKSVDILSDLKSDEAWMYLAFIFLQTYTRYVDEDNISPPERMLAQGFGDCADHTIFYHALFSKLGYQVNSYEFSLEALEPKQENFVHWMSIVDTGKYKYAMSVDKMVRFLGQTH